MIFAIVFNVKSFPIAIPVRFSSLLFTIYQKIFSNVLSVDNQKACDQDWTYFIGHIKKSKHN